MHSSGPCWTALDGSRTVGTVKARVDGAGPADTSLLLPSARPGSADGMLTGVISVQRLNKRGGNPPATACKTPADSIKRIKQGYSANYVFFAPR